MSVFQRQLQKVIIEYRESGQEWPATSGQIAAWAMANGKFDLQKPVIERVLRQELSQAMRAEYFIDEQGRRVRAKHPARSTVEGKSMVLWDDIRTAPRRHMQSAFLHRRNHIVGECKQARTDVDSYNDAHPAEEPIQLILDFNNDVEELILFEAAKNRQRAEQLSILEEADYLKVDTSVSIDESR